MNACVSDDYVVINIQGIRNARWGEGKSSSNPGKPWFISVTYKSSHNTYYYKTELEARAIFNKIREVMDKSRTPAVKFLYCYSCAKKVSTAFVPVLTDTPDGGLIVRANIECPECIEKKKNREEE